MQREKEKTLTPPSRTECARVHWIKFSARLFLLLAPLFLCARESEEALSKKIYSHLLVHDQERAIQEARAALVQFPESDLIEIAYMEALCQKGEELAALAEWTRISQRIEDKELRRHLLESLAWGVLNKADHSEQWLVRLFSLIGATLTQDARAIPLVMDALRDENATLRRAAIDFATGLGDQCLKEELLRMLGQEKAWHVRLSVIEAVGKLKLVAGKKRVKEILLSPKTTAEEKQAAITALVHLSEEITQEELTQLVQSKRAGMRELACHIVAHLQCDDLAAKLLPLLKDPTPAVRQSALDALGLLFAGKSADRSPFAALLPLLDDSAPEVAIAAAWAVALMGRDEGRERLEQWMSHPSPPLQRLSAAAMAKLGKLGTKLAKTAIKQTSDRYVKVSLAMALIGQRESVDLACETLYTFLQEDDKSLLMWDVTTNPIFPFISPSTLYHQPTIVHYPYVIDQIVRLELLSMLGMFHHPKALEAVKTFLHHQNTEVVGMAAATLIERGDEEAMKLVRKLLDDPNEKMRFSAALTLALFGKDPASIRILEEAYDHLPRDEKLHILEALGHIGDQSSIPFFIKQLGEPYQTLRVAAASSLMRCLYH